MVRRIRPSRIGPLWVLLISLALACGDGELTGTRRVLPVQPEGDLFDVAAPASEHLLIVSGAEGKGRLYLSRDGGKTFAVAQRPAAGILRSVSMATPQVGWAVGPAELLRTDDGGAHWRRQSGPRALAELDLFAVAAIDAQRAIALGRKGVRLRTEDGGAVWQEIAHQPAADGQDSGHAEGAVAEWTALGCAPDASGRCYAAADELYFTPDGGAHWQRVARLDALEIPPFVFGFGQFEIGEEEAVALRDRMASRPTGPEILWEIDARVSSAEIERIAEDGDPQALFELIESRGEELRLRLEGLGIAADRIVRVGLPPWDFEDFVDDDPDLLERYWADRLGDAPSARVRVREDVALSALVVGDDGGGIGIGRRGRGLEASAPNGPWRPFGVGEAPDLVDLARTADAVFAAGRAGTLWQRPTGAAKWKPIAFSPEDPARGPLRAIAFDPTGRNGYAVGDRGRLLVTHDGGARWHAYNEGPESDSQSAQDEHAEAGSP